MHKLTRATYIYAQINKGHGPKGGMMFRLGALAKEAGFRGLFAGLGPRMVMTGASFPQAASAPIKAHRLFSFQLASCLDSS